MTIGIHDLNSQNFDSEINRGQFVIVDFGAPWCPPCKALVPILNEVSAKHSVPVFALNVDDNPEIAARYGVKGLPTVLFFKNGVPVERVIGKRPLESYSELLKKYGFV